MSTTPHSEGYGQQPQPQYPVTPQVVRETISPRRSGWARLFLVLAVLFLAGSLFFNLILLVGIGLLAGGADAERNLQEKFVSGDKRASAKIAVISVEGVILEAEDGFVKRQIDQVMKDENVKAVVLRVDSPGGSVSGSDYIYHHLRQMKTTNDRNLPIVVSMGGIAASGGYYVAMAAGHTPDVIFAEPTGFTGSIGVIIPHYNVAGLMEKYGVESDSIASHPLKTMGSISRTMTKEEEKIFQALVADGFARFKEVVRSGRSQFDRDPSALETLATGQIFTTVQAKANGLVDRIGFVEDAVERAAELAGMEKGSFQVVKYKQNLGLAAALLGSQARQSSALDLKALLDMTTPRAYYLCTWLPGL